MKDAGISVKEPLERFTIPEEELFDNHEIWYQLPKLRSQYVNQWVSVREDVITGDIAIQIKTRIPDISSLPLARPAN